MNKSNAKLNVPVSQQTRPSRRSERLLQTIEPFAEVVILMHDNPDPDAIASGWAIKHLIEERTDKPVRLVGGGAIIRAENRYMVEVLEPPLELTDELELNPNTAIILVDCSEHAVNRLDIKSDNATMVAVLDHHQTPRRRSKVPFRDIRPRIAASATIAAGYLREQNLPPNVCLATALMYALRSETRGNQTYYSATDRAILPWLTRLSDPQMLAEIEDAPLPRPYFSDLVLALQSTFTYNDAAFCLLPRAESAEIVGEVADLLIREEDTHRVMCGAVVGDDVLVSVRTDEAGGNAADLVRKVLKGIGRGGGHSNRAGGKIANCSKDGRVSEPLHEQLRQRWLDVCGVDRQRGTRLVRRREIVDNL